jgi:hypothetical protein
MNGFGPIVIAAVVIPAILVAVVPRRWLVQTMIAWAVSPLFVYIGVILWETVSRPAGEYGLGNALLGFSLISAIFAIPWGIACLTGFAVGFGFRRIFRKPPPTVATVPDAAPQTTPVTQPIAFAVPAADASSDAIEWRQAHIGFSDDGLKIGGLDVWTHDWRSVDTPALTLCHPAYPQQMHRFTVQEIGEGASVSRFAVSELSNGVYGFYVPTRYPVEARGLSADGSLRFEQRDGEIVNGRPDAVATWAVLIDAETGRVLVDCAAWPASRITASPDGGLFLRLRQRDGETLLRTDPAARSFRDQGRNGAEMPLSELADTVERLRRGLDGQPPNPHYRHISPDGTIRIEIVAVEWGNSHWVNTPRVIDVASGRIVLDLWDRDWDASISWPGDRRVALDFRRYHFSGDLAIELDLANNRYTITREGGGGAPFPSGPLDEAEAAMEESGRRTAAFAARTNAARPIFDTGIRPGPFAAWRTALLILIVAAVLIAIAAAIAIRSEPARQPGLIREIPKPQLSPPPRLEPRSENGEAVRGR